ncbi:hypothetical protein B0A69_18130 [Chryseobacterium shigense]|uniref:Uncharacterized protein n=1 Tax=Chryseobacterium shigense TaxID=297244 RepID=A0A1N7K998_9FLAO|nr:hypothetical protein [Chryseobacterium shigense]PQA91174.1 hypothetical protein B0A69_18130 [Chryseobacterium shigense]SIS58153.1 hypothetical protein SAMN05421639_10915 [Chryseobacterium shigense]
MKNPDKVNRYQSITKKTEWGILTTLVAESGVSTHGNISFGEKTLLANYVYDKNGTYKLVYTIIDTQGNEESFAEDDGILPTLFVSPGHENYVSVVPYHPDKELEVSIPVFNRSFVELPKGNRPFTGKFVGTTHQFSVFYEVDIWSETKPDKMLSIEFKNDGIKKKHNIKIDLPRNNKIFMNNGEIHLLAKDKKGWLHRQIDELGHVKRERTIDSGKEWFWEILCLSFDENSYLLCEENGKISIETLSPDLECSSKDLADIGSEFFNTWSPVRIAENTFVMSFNGEFGNGWLTIKNDTLLELLYSKDEKGYKNLLTNEVLVIDKDNLIISGINKTAENSYAVIFYGLADGENKNKELIILNREIQ